MKQFEKYLKNYPLLPAGTYIMAEVPVSAFEDEDILYLFGETGLIIEINMRSIYRITFLNQRMKEYLKDTLEDIGLTAPWSRWGE